MAEGPGSSQGVKIVIAFPIVQQAAQQTLYLTWKRFLKQKRLALNPLFLLLVNRLGLGAGRAGPQTHVQGKHISSLWESELLKL